MRRKVTKAKGVHGGSRPRRDSTKAFTSVRREIDRRVARSVASKSMGTAGTAFRTFDSWKTDGQVFSPPLPRIDTRDGRVGRVFRGRFSGRKRKKEERKADRGERRGREREIEKGGKKGRKKETKREEERSTTNRLVGIERGFCAGYAALVGMEGKRRAIRRRRRGGGV